MAYKISFSSLSKEDKKVNPVKFIDTFVFQFLNPKGVMAGITLISKFVLEDDYFNSSLTGAFSFSKINNQFDFIGELDIDIENFSGNAEQLKFFWKKNR